MNLRKNFDTIQQRRHFLVKITMQSLQDLSYKRDIIQTDQVVEFIDIAQFTSFWALPVLAAIYTAARR